MTMFSSVKYFNERRGKQEIGKQSFLLESFTVYRDMIISLRNLTDLLYFFYLY